MDRPDACRSERCKRERLRTRPRDEAGQPTRYGFGVNWIWPAVWEENHVAYNPVVHEELWAEVRARSR